MGKIYIDKVKEKNMVATCRVKDRKDFILKSIEVFNEYKDVKKVIYRDSKNTYEIERKCLKCV